MKHQGFGERTKKYLDIYILMSQIISFHCGRFKLGLALDRKHEKSGIYTYIY
jgi:hypothetical protein